MALIYYRCIFSIGTRWRLEEITGIYIQNFKLFWLLTMLISHRKPIVKSLLSYVFLGFYGLKWIKYMLIWIYQYHIWLFALASLAVKYCSILRETYSWFGFALTCWYQIIRLLDTWINVHDFVLPWNVCPHILITNPNKVRWSTSPVRDSLRSLIFCKIVNGTLLENA